MFVSGANLYTVHMVIRLVGGAEYPYGSSSLFDVFLIMWSVFMLFCGILFISVSIFMVSMLLSFFSQRGGRTCLTVAAYVAVH